MKENLIKALKIAPLERPEICYLENNLESLQKAVSIGAEYVGLIEIIDLDERACIVCNEEGRLLGLEPNCKICGADFVGTIILCGIDGDEFADLPCEDSAVTDFILTRKGAHRDEAM